MLEYRRYLFVFLLVAIGLPAASTIAADKHESHDMKNTSQTHEKYVCPMHPQVVSDKPGSCPICKMDLEKVSGDASPDTSMVPGHSELRMNEGRRALIGMRLAPVTEETFSQDLQLTGRVAYDPELFSAIREYETARRTYAGLVGGDAGLKGSAERLLEASRSKLLQAGLSESELAAVGSSDSSSLLTGRGSAWVYGEAYEQDLAKLQVGQSVTVQATAYPGHEFKARLIAISPVLDAMRRTFTVRALPEDPQAMLKPNMYVSLIIKRGEERGISVPEDAVVRTGTQDLVYVATAEAISPRLVGLGRKISNRYQILSGLQPGEQVVSSAAFRLRAAGSTEHNHK